MKNTFIWVLITIILASCSKLAVEEEILEERAHRISTISLPEPTITIDTEYIASYFTNDSTHELIYISGNRVTEHSVYAFKGETHTSDKIDIHSIVGICYETGRIYRASGIRTEDTTTSTILLSKAINTRVNQDYRYYSDGDSSHYIIMTQNRQYKTDRIGRVMTDYNNHSTIYK